MGAMGPSFYASANSLNDHPSNAGLAPLDPSIEHLRREYRCRAEEIFADLRRVLLDKDESALKETAPLSGGKGMDDPWSGYRRWLWNCRQLLERALASGGDNSVLFRLSISLRHWKSLAPSHDPHVAAAMKAWENLQKVYFLEEKSCTPEKPTILFIHGSGIGPFPVFNGLFRNLAANYNVAFFLYDNLEPIDDISSRLNERWAAFRQQHNLAGPLRIVSLSYGTSILRYAALTRNAELWQGAALVEIAPVVLGSKYMKWLNAVPTEMFVLRLAAPNLRNWAKGVDGKERPQRLIWARQGTAGFDDAIPARLSLVPERDQHLSSEARNHLRDLLGDGKFVVIQGAVHDTAPGLREVISQRRSSWGPRAKPLPQRPIKPNRQPAEQWDWPGACSEPPPRNPPKALPGKGKDQRLFPPGGSIFTSRAGPISAGGDAF